MGEKVSKLRSIRWALVAYDIIILALISGVMLFLHPSGSHRTDYLSIIFWIVLSILCILIPRFIIPVYKQVWRYGGMTSYLRIIIADACGLVLLIACDLILPFARLAFGLKFESIRIISIICIVAINLLAGITIRMLYYYFYMSSGERSFIGKLSRFLLRTFGGIQTTQDSKSAIASENKKLRLAIVGGGRVGAALASDLESNPYSGYTPVCFIENDLAKVGRTLMNLPILYENSTDRAELENMGIEEVIIALPEASVEKKRNLYQHYKEIGLPVKVYDYPLGEASADGKRTIRDFTIEELLARKPIKLDNKEVIDYYKGKVVLVTGGGGSIGSELARQIAAMQVKQLIILDIAENSTYELQQDLKMKYGNDLNLAVEILTVCDKSQLEKVFINYKPQIVLHAAAHKHVPLMEHNSVECIKNNVYGSRNVMELAQKYKCEHFILVSTDKAVNPTNVMGATKRICELMLHVMARREGNQTIFSATRFGNVLGSAGSVVPLFKKQIAKGGPITLTHKDIIRYFMTIPEASQLVLTSGAMAKNGELFVLDMGKPVRIYDLAENMIKLSGYTPGVDIEIVETGLRPGEKLFEELLISGKEQGKTANELIFVEKDTPLEEDELERRLALLTAPVEALDDEGIKDVIAEVVPTYVRKK